MKTAFVVLATLAVVAAVAVIPLKESSTSLKCKICEDVCVDTDSWLATQAEHDENALVKKCEKLLGIFAKLVCDDFVKTELDDLIKHMSDPATEKEDCTDACQAIGFCKN
uniref:Saposin B-type domain-containing protein n=1 Tax=Panagrellus redivivus TaxID=6233 RepID=A0A7E4ZR45_PANRE